MSQTSFAEHMNKHSCTRHIKHQEPKRSSLRGLGKLVNLMRHLILLTVIVVETPEPFFDPFHCKQNY